MAKRVLPTPPAPVNVNKRDEDSNLAISFNSFCRPMKLVSGTGIFEETSFVTGFVIIDTVSGASLPDLRLSYNSFVCSDGSIPNSRKDFTQRSYAAATFDMSPFAACADIKALYAGSGFCP